MKVKLILVVLVVMLAGRSWAENIEISGNTLAGYTQSETVFEKIPVIHLEELIVVASPIIDRTEVTIFGDAVSIVTADQIDMLNAQDLATALYKVPGITMSRHNVIGAFGGGEGGAVFIRGHGASRPGQATATLVDGIPKFSGIWTHSLLDMLPIDSLELIKIYKSAQPVRYGNMSNGVINMISKRRKEEGVEARSFTGFGSHQTWIQRLEVGFNSNGFDGYFVGHLKDSEGHRENAGGQVNGLYACFGYGLTSNWKASVQVHHTLGSVEDPGAEGTSVKPSVETFNTKSNMEIVTISHEYVRIKGELKIYQDMGLQDWKQWDEEAQEPFCSVTKYANYGLRLQEELEIIEHSELLVGIDYDFYGGWFAEEHYLNNLLETNLHFRNTAPYLMAAYTIGETISLTPSIGARYNFSDYFEDVIGYQMGLKGVMDAINLTLYANHSKGYNLPGVYSAILFGGGPGGDGWQDLDAEQVNHFEAGLTHAVTKKLRYHIAYFHDQVTSALNVVLPPPPPARYENIGEHESKGINAEIQIVPIDKLDVFVGGTWTQTDPEDSPYAPEWTATAGLNYNLLGLVKLGVIMQITDNYYTGNPRSPQPNQLMEKYNLVNMRASCPINKITAIKVKGEVFIAIENMLNTGYKLKPDYPMPGTTVMIGTDIKI